MRRDVLAYSHSHVEVEEAAHPEREWIADVMAVHTSGNSLRGPTVAAKRGRIHPPVPALRCRWHRASVGRPREPRRLPGEAADDRVGLRQSSDLPEAPAALMDPTRDQPVFADMARVGIAVDWVLHPLFSWQHGTPQHQLDEITRLDKERAEREAAAQREAEQKAEAKRLADEKTALAAAELVARFIEPAGDDD